MVDLFKVMERECLHSEHAAQCFIEAKRRGNRRALTVNVAGKENSMCKQKPTGFIARCPWCGVITGAIDYERTDRKEAGTLLGQWLVTGHIVEPRFSRGWSVDVKSCACNDPL